MKFFVCFYWYWHKPDSNLSEAMCHLDKGHAKQVDAAYAKECALEGMARTQVIWLKEGVIKA